MKVSILMDNGDVHVLEWVDGTRAADVRKEMNASLSRDSPFLTIRDESGNGVMVHKASIAAIDYTES